MNKIKIISLLSLGASIPSIFLSNNSKLALASTDSIYSIINESYILEYSNNTLKLKFKNNSIHNDISEIKLFDPTKNKLFKFEKDYSDFKLPLIGENLKSGIYTLVFNDKYYNSYSSKELYLPIYFNSPELSNQNTYITSLNPIISLTNLNGVYKLNARFTLLNIQDDIVNAKIIDENDLQVGTLENNTNPKNFVFNLGSSPLSLNKNYYIEYSLEDDDGEIYTLRIPFSYSANSIQINPISTNNFTYTSTVNSNNTVNLNLKFKGINPNEINIYDARNSGVQYTTRYDNSGNIILENVPVDTILKIEIGNNFENKILNFKVSNSNIYLETPIPFMKFINASGLVLKRGTKLTVPIIKDDLLNAGFTTQNTYIKFVYYNEFGNEVDLTDEKRISTSTSQADLIPNANINNLLEHQQIFVKVSTPTKSILFPFDISKSSMSSTSLAFDVIKNSSLSNQLSLTFKPNSNLLPLNETFSSNDLLIVNDSYNATLSGDRRSFNITIPKDKIIPGVNTYTFIKNYGANNVSYTGEFLVDSPSNNVKVENIIKSIIPITSNQKELILRVSLNDSFTQPGLNTSVKITDELGKNITSKTTVKQIGSNKVLDISINPVNQLLSGKSYNIQINNGSKTLNTNFIYNNSWIYNTNFDLIFNSFSKFTLKNLDSLPGYPNYDFNLKIYDYYNNNDVLYENFTQSNIGETFKTGSITRDLKNGKNFIDGNNYIVEFRNTSTGDIHKQTFTFRQSNIVGQDGSSQQTINSQNITFESDGINFSYSLPQNKTINEITCNTPDIKASYSNGRIYINGLVPSKLYRNLSVNIRFSDGSTQNIKINEFTSQVSNNKLKNYLSKVYSTTLTPVNQNDKNRIRYADEAGFNYWYDSLSNQRISGPEFIYRILDENEFNSVQSSTEDKIRALYPIIVNRVGDTNGLNFWINELNILQQSMNSQSTALKVILAKMLNEEEPKQLFKNLGIRIQ